MQSKLYLLTIVLFLYGCNSHHHVAYSKKSSVVEANNFLRCSIEDTSTDEAIANKCLNDTVKQLIDDNLLLAKIKLLKQNKEFKKAEKLLKYALEITSNSYALQEELVFLYVLQNHWLEAQKLINVMELKTNDSLRLIIESHTGEFSAGTNFNLLPQIVKNKINEKVAQRAIVESDYLTYFNLSRVDNAMNGINSYEPSIKVSNDGQKILVAWMDETNSSTNRWIGNSAYSSDGGNTWQNYLSSPCTETETGGYLDMNIAYDPVNNYMYSAGMRGSFGGQSDCFYIYRTDLNDNSRTGPYIIQDSNPNAMDFDKVFIASNDSGELWMSTNYPGALMYSNDFGENFNEYANAPTRMAQTLFHNNCLYLLSHHSNKLWRCDLGLTSPELITPATYEFYYHDYIPGNFIVHKFSYMAFHPNGDLFIIYPELIDVNSDEVAIWMSRSSDNGSTWDDPWIVTPDIPGDRFLQWIEIDQLGGIHISYVDTRNMVQDDNSEVAKFDMYYSYSIDSGQTWKETRVTPTSLLSQGTYSFVGDYTEMSVGNSNAVFLSFAWQSNPNISDFDMYVAKKQIRSDLIFKHGFE